MFALKLFFGLVLVVTASARYVVPEDQIYPLGYDDEGLLAFEEDEPLQHEYASYHPGYLASARVRRQAQGSVTLNSDGGMGLGGKVPIVGNEKNVLSAVGSVDLNNQMLPVSRGMGLALDNV